MKKKLLFSVITIFTCIATTTAQNVTIPDANFKAYLVGNASINTNVDTEIQVSEAQAIGYLDVSALNISDLTGISAFTNLTVLYCQSNQITSLDVSSNLLLVNFYCAYNQLTSLDISLNTSITDFRAANNLLTTLNVKNGNNSNFAFFTANGNPDLTCIEVDDAAYSTSNWTYIDPTASFSEDCSGTSGIDNYSLEDPIIVYPNPTLGSIFLSGNYNITLTDLTGKIILQDQNTNSIDLSNHSNGSYLIQLSKLNGEIVCRSRVTKE